MKIITWNIRHGGGKRIKDILSVLKRHQDAEVVVLTEFRANANLPILVESLRNLGFQQIVHPSAEPKNNSVMVASKVKATWKVFPELAEHQQRVVQLSYGECQIYGTYFPLKNKKVPVFDFFLAEAKKQGPENMLIVGDFNTGKHYLDEAGATFYQSEYLERLEELGLEDLWRAQHGDKRAFSWFSPRKKNGFRIDHMYGGRRLAKQVKDCYYDQDPLRAGFSDHALMVLELN
jgi:exodeoxyribonuclease III